MSTISNICKYLDISDDEMSINDFNISSPPNSLDSEYLRGYESEPDSYLSSSYESNLNYDPRDIKIEPLNSITKLDVSTILNFVSEIVNLMCRLTCNSKSNKEEMDIYINDTKELTKVLQSPPEKYRLMKNKACSEILINAQTMKNNITESLNL